MDLITWLALIVAVLAIPTTIWSTRRWGNRRAILEFASRTVPLLPDGESEGLLELTFRQIAVPNPHLVTIWLSNTGPKDISSADFDSGKPLILRFPGVFYGVTRVDGVRPSTPDVGSKGARLEIAPTLMKRGDTWSINAVVSGSIKVDIESPLIETDIVPALGKPNSSVVAMAVLQAMLPELPFGKVVNRLLTRN